MMKIFKFIPQLTHHDVMRPRSQEEIENEPILFQSSFDFAMENGGNITREFLIKLPDTENVLIDSRVHMLMPGWYPAIPGWHLDYVPRSLPNAQPDLAQTDHQIHYMCIIGNGISNPEFICQPIELIIDENKPIYSQCNEQITQIKPDTIEIADNNIWKFSSKDFHQAVPAKKDGWRFFIRASYNTGKIPVNKIRKQCQVYLPHGFKAW